MADVDPTNTRASSRVIPYVLTAVIVALIVGALVWVFKPVSDSAKLPNYGLSKNSAKLQVGFVTVGPTSDWGYNYAHNQGRLFMEANLRERVHSVIAENIPENAEVERVMQRMIEEGARLIYSTSYGYRDFSLRVAANNPKVIFMQALGSKQTANLGTYSLRVWEPAYVAGVVAAMTVKENKRLGFIGAHPVPPILWTVNAFALGAQSVDPGITVDVVYTNSWNNPAAEAEAVKSLADRGEAAVYVLVDSPVAGVQAAERAGIYALAHFADLSNFAPTRWLTGTSWKWGNLYEKVTKEVLDGSWKSGHIDGGFQEGYVGLAPFGPAVEWATQVKAQEVIKQIASGKLNVFGGPITDSAGKERVSAGNALTIDQIFALDWVVKGVRGGGKS